MSGLDKNEENASRMVGRSVVKVRVPSAFGAGQAEGLWVDLDDGSRIILSGMRGGQVEIDWQSSDDAFEFDREVMEEELGGPPNPDL